MKHIIILRLSSIGLSAAMNQTKTYYWYYDL